VKNILIRFLKFAGYEVLNLNIIRQSATNNQSFLFERYVCIVSDRKIKTAGSEEQFFQTFIKDLVIQKPSITDNFYVIFCTGIKRYGFYIQFNKSSGQYFSNDVSTEKELQFKQILSNPGQIWELHPATKNITYHFSLSNILIAGFSGTFETNKTFHELDFMKKSFPHLKQSTSQIFQDLLALYCKKYEQGGFFIEFGATNGYSLSNTWMLEKSFQWKGILCEPGRTWHEQLRKNRYCIIDERCVWSATGHTLTFNEAPVAELSTIQSFSNTDHHAHERENGSVYNVQTISLNDLLDEHDAPAVIDYMSVDTEGSELEILKAFDFSKRKVNVLSVEHNYTENREVLFQLLQANGFVRVFTSLSRFDDWYVQESLFKSLN
jgi:FkbM family methyltransferase